ncbi:MAG TPA: hypothetical protein VF711_11575 [Acidimicrobiales bacterium]
MARRSQAEVVAGTQVEVARRSQAEVVAGTQAVALDVPRGAAPPAVTSLVQRPRRPP